MRCCFFPWIRFLNDFCFILASSQLEPPRSPQITGPGLDAGLAALAAGGVPVASERTLARGRQRLAGGMT